MRTRIRPTLFIFIFLIIINPIVFADGDTMDSKELSRKDFSIIDYNSGVVISFFDNMIDIISNIGDPVEIVIGPNTTSSKWDRMVYKYPAFWATAYREWMEIIYLWVQSDQYSTVRGISIGDSFDDLIDKYGKPDYSQDGEYMYQLEIEETGGYWILSF